MVGKLVKAGVSGCLLDTTNVAFRTAEKEIFQALGVAPPPRIERLVANSAEAEG